MPNTDPPRTAQPIIESAAMASLYTRARRIARTDEPILLLGETGTGKGVLARDVHGASARADRPFLVLNCAALPESLIESELFGYRAGAFTGASKSKKGLLETVDGGTLFLDEIGELPLPTQAKLLHVLEAGTFLPVGATATSTSDFRLIAASNRDLFHAKEDGSFRSDLFFRIGVFILTVPPLRERLEELPAYTAHFLEEVRSRLHMTPKALERMLCHHWPGNVRELRNVVRHAALLADGDAIDVEDLPDWILEGCPRKDVLAQGTWRDRVQCFERGLLEAQLDESGGDVDAALKRLGISRSSFYRKLRQGRPADAEA